MCYASVKRESNLRIVLCIRERPYSEINCEVREVQPGVLRRSQHLNDLCMYVCKKLMMKRNSNEFINITFDLSYVKLNNLMEIASYDL